MKLQDLKVKKGYTIESATCKLLTDKPVCNDNGMVELGEGEQFVFVTEGKEYPFQMVDNAQQRRALDYLRLGYPCLAERTNQGRTSVFSLCLVFFSEREYFGELNIVLSEEQLEKLRTKKRRLKELSDVNHAFSLTAGAGHYFAYSVQSEWRAQDSAGFADPEEEGEEDGPAAEPRKKGSEQNVLRLYGDGMIFSARLEGEDEIVSCLVADQMQFSMKNLPCMQLGVGELKFTLERTATRAKVIQALQSSPGYVDLWDRYAEKEGEFLLRKTRAVSVLHLNRSAAAINGDNIEVPVKPESREALKWIQEGDRITFSAEEPLYLMDETLSWQEWDRDRRSAPWDRDDDGETGTKARAVEQEKQLEVVGKRGGRLILKGSALPEGTPSLSILGSKISIDRRRRARDAIRNRTAANPRLGLIIEGVPCLEGAEKRSGKDYVPLSPLVLDKIFRYPPTLTQKRAIEIALNTPDIAIIQGPPGTGKTTVITAIIERLNELADKSAGVRGEVLVTSLQHDAVINIQERLSINSLPTIKFGDRSKKEQEEDFDFATESWCDDRVSALKAKHLSLQFNSREAELQRLGDLYLRSPGSGNALALLNYALTVNTSVELGQEIRRLIEELNLHTQENTNQLERAIRRLRTTKAAFLDDGPEAAMQVYRLLAEIMDPEDSGNRAVFRQLQTAALSGGQEPTPELLSSMRELKAELLGKCIPPPFYRKENPRMDIINIYEQVKQMARSPENETDRILYQYLSELENNTVSVRESLKNYCFVFTSTLLQSAGKEIRKAKGNHVEYDTVIVDEAARANPGDLMIPMTQARRRIILVGDHRQLPHMYDEDIFEELQSDGKVKNEMDIKVSMFQHLMENAKKLEKADGIPRTITLDAQYRMHPELGRFVSRQFYEASGEQFASPLPAEHFSQSISESPVLWLNYGRGRGGEGRSEARSRYRLCEAEGIVRRLETYLADPSLKDLTFGVISFYSAQVREIRDRMRSSRLMARALEKGRVRVGSVDSFQGMEFDVIFLSVVRSGSRFADIDFAELERDTDSLPPEDERRIRHEEYVEKVGMREYGFLISRNRLCVALSRQKRLLIVVGDKAMFSGGDAGRTAEQCVPAMAALYRLCQEKGAVIECSE